MTLSVVIITFNEEANIGRTLASVQELVRALGGEIIVVDSGSTDRTREIAESHGAKVFVEEWKGFAAQKNSAIEKASGNWILSLDADEELTPELIKDLRRYFNTHSLDAAEHPPRGFTIPRRNMFLGRWMRHGGFWPDRKIRLFARGEASFENRLVHEDVRLKPPLRYLEPHPIQGALLHHAYPTLDIYLEHMRRYADLGAEMIRDKPRPLLLLNRWLNPPLTFLYNYVFRLGFLDGREGFLLHWNHSRYVAWKYAKALELSRAKE